MLTKALIISHLHMKQNMLDQKLVKITKEIPYGDRIDPLLQYCDIFSGIQPKTAQDVN
jgi:hypothetical protein